MSVLETRKTPIIEDFRIYDTFTDGVKHDFSLQGMPTEWVSLQSSELSLAQLQIGNGKTIMRIDSDMKVTLSEDIDVSTVSALPLDALLLLKAVIDKAIETK